MRRGEKRRRRYLPALIVGVAVIAVCGGAFALVRSFLKGAPPEPKKAVQEVHIIRPPPPPPDLPPPPPPPPEEKVDVPDPQQKPDPTPSNEPPPGEQLGLDTEGGAGSDAFGLFGNKGGRELIGSGGNAYSWYAGLLKNQILDQLGNEKHIRTGSYSMVVRFWVRPDGTIERIRIVEGSGDRERDRVIEAALSRITRLTQAPPADMPEPISLRIGSHG